jgi:hypothetical protein
MNFHAIVAALAILILVVLVLFAQTLGQQL